MDAVANLDWDHLRFFLAVMRAPSLRQAAARLDVSHPTIRRRLEALEAHVGLQLFDRRRDGLRATPQAVELLDVAEEVEASIFAFGRRAAEADPELRGPVRVTAPDVLISHLLMPDLAAFSERWPQIDLQVDTGNEVADLGAREADVAIRAVRVGGSPDGSLTGRKAATLYSAVYGSPHQWIGWWGADRDRSWVEESAFPDLPVRGAMQNIYLQKAACQQGLGLTTLGCFFAEPELERRCEPFPTFDLWVLVHPDLRRSPRLRVFRDEMVAALKTHKPRLEGSNSQ